MRQVVANRWLESAAACSESQSIVEFFITDYDEKNMGVAKLINRVLLGCSA